MGEAMAKRISKLQLLLGEVATRQANVNQNAFKFKKAPKESDIMLQTMRELAKEQGLPNGYLPIINSVLTKLRAAKADEEKLLKDRLAEQQKLAIKSAKKKEDEMKKINDWLENL